MLLIYQSPVSRPSITVVDPIQKGFDLFTSASYRSCFEGTRLEKIFLPGGFNTEGGQDCLVLEICVLNRLGGGTELCAAEAEKNPVILESALVRRFKRNHRKEFTHYSNENTSVLESLFCLTLEQYQSNGSNISNEQNKFTGQTDFKTNSQFYPIIQTTFWKRKMKAKPPKCPAL